MHSSVLERSIEQTFNYINQTRAGRIATFIWHGGEPMIAGRDFYMEALEYQVKYAQGARIENSIQTNGSLIDEKWIHLFKKAGIGVSISIDGPEEINDKNRVDHQGNGSYKRVIEKISMVKDAGIPLGVCLVISKSNKDRASEIYEFLVDNRLPFNIIPLNKSGSARENYLDLGLEADEYAEPWIAMYDRWFTADSDYVYCSDFVYKTRAIFSGIPADCIGLKNCSATNISIDPIGDVYPCASLSGHQDTKYGNIMESDLQEILNSNTARKYLNRATDPQCAECKWQHICHGGCQARAYKFFGENNKRDYYCPSLFRIYEHVESRLAEKFAS
jgi:uncharacterized protein